MTRGGRFGLRARAKGARSARYVSGFLIRSDNSGVGGCGGEGGVGGGVYPFFEYTKKKQSKKLSKKNSPAYPLFGYVYIHLIDTVKKTVLRIQILNTSVFAFWIQKKKKETGKTVLRIQIFDTTVF